MEQITRDKFPSNGGWKFRQPQFGNWENRMALVGFDASVKNIIQSRKQNRAIALRSQMSTDYVRVSNELLEYNRKIRGIPNSVPTQMPAPVHFKMPPPDTSSPRIAGKICITTTFDRNYALSGKVMMKSIRHYTDCHGVDFKIITGDEAVLHEFGPENCHFVDDAIKARYANVKYSPDLPPEKYHSSWYRYELFSFKGYDRVICIDSDCLCLRDLSYLFSQELSPYDIISVEDHIVSKCFTRYVPELTRMGLNFTTLNQRKSEGKIDIQPALIVANRSLLTGDWYNALIHYANTTGFTYSIDEGILNDFIYLKNLKIRLLPLEYDYQDLYEMHCWELPVPTDPVIVHCQESKPFKKEKQAIDPRMHKWHDLWWKEHNRPPQKTVVVIMIYNRLENLKLWLKAWDRCNQREAELVVIHNQESADARYAELCKRHGVRYVPRANVGFDMGAFQDVCRERLAGFPNDWDNLIWITDDCIPMNRGFVQMFISALEQGYLPCYEISTEKRLHVRTTGFMVTKPVSKRLSFPADPITSRNHCYEFEHRSRSTLYDQLMAMGHKLAMVCPALEESPLWDTGCRGSLNLMAKHKSIFPD